MVFRYSNTARACAREHHHAVRSSARATRALEAACRPHLTADAHPGRDTPIEPSPPLGGLEASRSSHRPRKFIFDASTGRCPIGWQPSCVALVLELDQDTSPSVQTDGKDVIIRMPWPMQCAMTHAKYTRVAWVTVRGVFCGRIQGFNAAAPQ